MSAGTTHATTPLTVDALLGLSPVVPVVVLRDVEHAVPVARALARGGVPVVELTLRTPVALEALRLIAQEVPEVVVGAGTVTTPAQAEAAAEAGARFLVTPGTTPTLLEAALATGLALLPGAATVSEALALRERGLSALKLFPAEASGGRAFLSAVAGPLPDVRWCPTGGISVASAPEYLALPTVACVGGSWLTPAASLAEGDWAVVEHLAAEAAALR